MLDVQATMKEVWEQIFAGAEFDSPEQPIKNNDFCDPFSKVTKGILYIYAMETFIYFALNEATRNFDKTKIATLGPFALALGRIIWGAENKSGRNKDKNAITGEEITTLYKGMKLN